jgi:transposase
LRFRGDYGSGKSRALSVFGSILNKGFFASGASTVSPIFHTLDTFRASLILDDGRLCMTNNAAERALRGIAIGRHNWTFAGSDAGGRRAAAIYTLIEAAKLNDIDPQAWLADVLARLHDHPAKRIAELMPWNCKRQLPQRAAA